MKHTTQEQRDYVANLKAMIAVLQIKQQRKIEAK